ncbi:MAG TPA: CapA family protein [Actinomycetes bacterium]|nr:CapA family protein [Actinomycetes bacterium]
MITLALLGDTMLGRGVANELDRRPADSLVSTEVARLAAGADLTVLNLECAISDRGEPWPEPGKRFFFRAPPVAVQTLLHLGVVCVTCANNHALDFGSDALHDTLRHLDEADIAHVGAGSNLAAARAPAILTANGLRIGVLGFTDHPADFAATADSAGVAYADLRAGPPDWVLNAIGVLRDCCDVVVATPHWGPNMTSAPLRYVQAAGDALLAAGATLVAGHSAHVFHPIARVDGAAILYDLGDFIDDYATDPVLRNDLGVLWRVSVDAHGVQDVEAVPIVLEYAHTRLATLDEIRRYPVWTDRLAGRVR